MNTRILPLTFMLLAAGCGSSNEPSPSPTSARDAGEAAVNDFSCTGVAERCDQGALLFRGDCEALDQCDPYHACRTRTLLCFDYASQPECVRVGCSWEGECSGSALSCSSYLTPAQCNMQPGCSWSAALDDCRGARSCLLQENGIECGAIEGCRWSEDCRGTADANACNEAGDTSSECETTSVCGWQYIDCRGNEFACARHTDETTCVAEAGCSWTRSG